MRMSFRNCPETEIVSPLVPPSHMFAVQHSDSGTRTRTNVSPSIVSPNQCFWMSCFVRGVNLFDFLRCSFCFLIISLSQNFGNTTFCFAFPAVTNDFFVPLNQRIKAAQEPSGCIIRCSVTLIKYMKNVWFPTYFRPSSDQHMIPKVGHFMQIYQKRVVSDLFPTFL